MSETDICCVCHENLDENADPCFSCNNRIHLNCWARWIAVRNNCPLCRMSQGTRRGGLEAIPEENPVVEFSEPDTPVPEPELVAAPQFFNENDIMQVLIPDGNGSLTTAARLLDQVRELTDSRNAVREQLRTRQDIVTYLRTENRDLHRTVDALRLEFLPLRLQVRELREERNTQQDAATLLQMQVDNMQRDMARLRSENVRLASENRLLLDEREILEERPARRRRV